MALKRRKILKQQLNIGYGTTTIPADSGGTLTGDLIGLHTFAGNFINAQHNGAAGDGAADDTTALQNSITAIAAFTTDGVLYLPPGNYKTTAALTMASGVSIYGAGPTKTVIQTYDTNGLSFAFTGGETHKLMLRDFTIAGQTGTTRTAIIQAGTTDSSDELYGVTIENVDISGFNVGIATRTTRVWTVRDVRMLNINSGIQLVGKNFNWDIQNVRIAFNNGNGSGTADGLKLDQFTYAVGGSIAPESINVDNFFVNGVTGAGVRLTQAVHTNLSNIDIMSKGIGILIGACTWDCNIRGAGIELQTTAATYGVLFNDQSALNTQVNINVEGVHCVSTGATNAVAFSIDTSGGAGNQAYIVLRGCSAALFTSYDCSIYNAGNIEITGCKFYSSGNAASIYIDSVLTGRQIFIHDNPWLQGYIKAAASIKSNITIGFNGGTYTTALFGRSTILAGTSTVTTTYQSLLGNTVGSTPAFAAQGSTGFLLVTTIMNKDDISAGQIVTVNAVAGTTSMVLTTNVNVSGNTQVWWKVEMWYPSY